MSIRELSARLPRSRLVQPVFEQVRELELSAVFWLTAITLLSSLLLGGGTRSGFLSDAILQLLSIPPLLVFAFRLNDLAWRDRDKFRQVKFALGFCFAVTLVPLIQLVPLPPWLWASLPNRGAIMAVFEAVGRTPGWMPISISPDATSLSALALIPPLAIFSGTILLSYRERRFLSLLIVAFGIVSSFLGLLQLSQGPSSPMRFFSITNTTEAVGFFANRNHFAALLYTTLLFAAVWAIDVGFTVGIWRGRKTFEAGSIGAITASFLAIVVLLAADAMARSRAGMTLTMVSLVGICVLMFSDRRRTFTATPVGFLLAAAGTAFIFIVQFGLYRILETFAADPLEDSRFQFLRNTIEAARDYLPFGSGMGTFVPVYAMYERPADTFAQYVNHAHNDIAELSLESGVVGMALLVLFAAWFVSRSEKIWLRAAVGASEFDRLLAGAATIVVALLISHSLVDYPLRTAAMMGVFAFACSLMLPPLSADRRRAERGSRSSRHAIADGLAAKATAISSAADPLGPAPPNPAVTTTPPRGTSALWGEGIDWPEAWRKPSLGRNPKTDKPTTPEEPDTK